MAGLGSGGDGEEEQKVAEIVPKPLSEFPESAYPKPVCSTLEMERIVACIPIEARWKPMPPGSPPTYRFRGLKFPPGIELVGSLLFELTDALYLSKTGQTIFLWKDLQTPSCDGEDFKRLAKRDVTNPRLRGSTTNRYSQRFLGEGWFPKLRGALEARYVDADPEVACMISGGTCAAGFIMARKSHPTNIYVIRMGRDGCQGVNVLHAQSPDDMCKFRKVKSNLFLEKGGVNAIEMMDEQPDVLSNWKHHCLTNKLSHETCASKGDFTFQKHYERYVESNYVDLFGPTSTFTTWQVVQSTRNLLDGIKGYELYRDTYDRYAEDSDASAMAPAIMRNTKDLISDCLTFQDAHNLEVIRESSVALCGLLFPGATELALLVDINADSALGSSAASAGPGPVDGDSLFGDSPGNSGAGGGDAGGDGSDKKAKGQRTEFAFSKYRPGLTGILTQEMTGTIGMKTLQKETKAAQSAYQAAQVSEQEKEAAAAAEQPDSKRRRVSTAGTKKALERLGKSIVFESAVDTDAGSKRAIRSYDLIIIAVYSPVSGLRKDLIDWPSLRESVRMCGAFFLYDQVVIDGTLYKGVGKLHAVLLKLRQKTLDRHMNFLVRLHGSVDAVNKSLASIEDGSGKNDSKPKPKEETSDLVAFNRAADELFQDHGWVHELVMFMKEKNSLLNAKSFRIHPQFISMMSVISNTAPTGVKPEVVTIWPLHSFLFMKAQKIR